MTTSAISSAVEPSAFLTTSRVIGSTSGTGVHLDVPVGVEPRHASRRDDAGRVDLVDEQRPGQLDVEQSRAGADGRLDSSMRLAEVRKPGALVEGKRADRGDRVVTPARRALEAADHAERDDVDWIVCRAVAVGPD